MDTVTIASDPFQILSVDGHIVTISFAKEKNDNLTHRLKQILISSYSDECLNHRIAISEQTCYNAGGKTHEP